MVKTMKLAAVVIWYNPKSFEESTKKVLSYSPCAEKVYIVDNSSVDNSALTKEIPNAVYIPNLKNLGIAEAQNIGCQRALEDGFEWAMTMDQDSSFDSGVLEKYIELSENHTKEDQKSASFSLSMKDDSKNILPLSVQAKKKLKAFLIKHLNFSFPPPKEREPIDHPDRCYASGNIINLLVWSRIGKFDSSLFIDEVDFDFCIRLLLNGYIITRFNTISLNHKLGNRKITLFPKCSYHTGKRLFFIIRNKLIENKRYGTAIKLEHDYRKEIFQYFKDYCIFDIKAFTNLIIFIKAFRAYKEFIKNDPTYQNLKEKGLAK